MRTFGLLTLAAASICLTAAGADYFVSPKGDDKAAGTKAAPWRSIGRVNQAQFKAGDRVLFEGGQTFKGRLALGTQSSGAEKSPVVLSSFGKGRARIDGGTGEALILDGAAHVRVESLDFIGAGRKSGSTTSGVVIRNSRHVEVTNIETSGFGTSGLYLDGAENVRITKIRAHLNGGAL